LTTAVIAAIAALVTATVAAVLSYSNSQRMHRRQERLVRISKQLSELYGPLLALLEANKRSYEKFLGAFRAGSNAFFNPNMPETTQEQLEAWKLWVRHVFQPTNRKIFDLVVSKADLLIDDEMPDFLLDFCAHKAGFDVTLARWDEGDFTSHLSLLPHPGEPLNQYARESFSFLKKAQAKLLLRIPERESPETPEGRRAAE
jgi:hypothetical protein